MKLNYLNKDVFLLACQLKNCPLAKEKKGRFRFTLGNLYCARAYLTPKVRVPDYHDGCVPHLGTVHLADWKKWAWAWLVHCCINVITSLAQERNVYAFMCFSIHWRIFGLIINRVLTLLMNANSSWKANSSFSVISLCMQRN